MTARWVRPQGTGAARRPRARLRRLAEGVLPPWQIAGLLEDDAPYRAGEAGTVSPDVERVTGHPPTDVDAFARRHAAEFAPV